jgi:ATP-dependent 26S proteasome regulatory subunit
MVEKPDKIKKNLAKSVQEMFNENSQKDFFSFDKLKDICVFVKDELNKNSSDFEIEFMKSVLEIIEKLEIIADTGSQNQLERGKLLSKIDNLEESLIEAETNLSKLLSDNKNLTIKVKDLEERNKNLVVLIRTVKDEIEEIRQEVEKLKSPPLPYGVFLRPSVNWELAVISVDGRHYEVNVANDMIKLEALVPGQQLLLNSTYNILDIRPQKIIGDVATVLDVLDKERAIIKCRHDAEVVVGIADSLRNIKLKIGDHVRYDDISKMIFEILPKSELEEIVLEEVPEIKYSDIGGLEKQIEEIKDSIEFPYIYKHLFKEFKLKPPKGILLYGPPGCGKTLIAKAVAHNLSLRINQNLKENHEALKIYKALKIDGSPLQDFLEIFENLKRSIYKREHIYGSTKTENIDELYQQIDESGILGDFLRRTSGKYTAAQFLDLQIELADNGFVGLDPQTLGHFLEEKSKRYLLHKKKVSDEMYVMNWLENYLEGYDINLTNVLNELKRIEEKIQIGIKGYFLNIKGPELLNKYVGETEYRIREVFIKAGEKAECGFPVIVFFDEMESMFRTRGSGISTDIESTIVPQFLSELDGVESIENVIVIGASNRQDLIDPAVLRPGRLDVKIKIDRPDKDAAKDIFSKYIIADLPWHKTELEKYNNNTEQLTAKMIEFAVEEMYATKKENEFLKVTYRDGDEEILYFKDFASGAMIEAIVSRTKKYALKRMIITGDKGIKCDDLLKAIRGEYKENEDLPNTTNPDDWSKISGKKGKAIANIKTIMQTSSSDKKKESEEIAVSSRYL